MRALVLAGALVALVPARAQTSVTAPTPVGEPLAAFAGLRVVSQRLVVDLRPLARSGARLAVVESTYEIVNAGAARTVPLALAAAGDATNAVAVELDGQPVPAAGAGAFAAPDAWRSTATSPGLDGAPVPLGWRATGPWTGRRAAPMVPPGRHVLSVRQRVAAGSFETAAAPMRVWQVAYSLAPARFRAPGRLDVVVRAPAQWDVAASLPLRAATDAEGLLLTSRFQGVPGDVLAVSARAPEPAGRLPLRLAGLAAALAAVAAAGWLGRRARRSAHPRVALPVAVAGGALAAAALFASHAAIARLGDSGLYGVAQVFSGGVVVAPLAFALGTAVAWMLSRR